jgi:uncharacterized repeat protein (TIGR01451 family)
MSTTGQSDLAVGLQPGNITAFMGHDFGYVITVTNLGPNTASNIVVSDATPSNVAGTKPERASSVRFTGQIRQPSRQLLREGDLWGRRSGNPQQL